MVCVSPVWCFGFFFFSSRRRHTRCALVTGVQTCALPIWQLRHRTEFPGRLPPATVTPRHCVRLAWQIKQNIATVTAASAVNLPSAPSLRDRKSVVSGKSVSVRVDLGGRRIIKKKKKKDKQTKCYNII